MHNNLSTLIHIVTTLFGNVEGALRRGYCLKKEYSKTYKRRRIRKSERCRLAPDIHLRSIEVGLGTLRPMHEPNNNGGCLGK